MATLSIASAKGGCGKTTVAILLGAELALDGYKVALLDCDLNQHASAFGAKAKIPGLTIVGNVAEDNVLAVLKKAEADQDDAQDLARSPIARAMVWTRFLPGFESKSARHVRESLEGQGVTILKSALMERAAFREIHITGQVPRQVDPASGAAANISAMAIEILGQLKSLAEAA